MRYRVLIHEAVSDELQDAVRYYESRQAGLGLELLDEWEHAVKSVQANPLGYEKKYKQFRQALLNRFPYLVMFEVEDNDIVVYRFINARRHPKKKYPKKY